MESDVQVGLEALLRSRAELDRRATSGGYRGLEELLATHRQLELTLRGIDIVEIDRALAELARVIAGVRKLDREVRDLAWAKENLGTPEEI